MIHLLEVSFSSIIVFQDISKVKKQYLSFQFLKSSGPLLYSFPFQSFLLHLLISSSCRSFHSRATSQKRGFPLPESYWLSRTGSMATVVQGKEGEHDMTHWWSPLPFFFPLVLESTERTSNQTSLFMRYATSYTHFPS